MFPRPCIVPAKRLGAPRQARPSESALERALRPALHACRGCGCSDVRGRDALAITRASGASRRADRLPQRPGPPAQRQMIPPAEVQAGVEKSMDRPASARESRHEVSVRHAAAHGHHPLTGFAAGVASTSGPPRCSRRRRLGGGPAPSGKSGSPPSPPLDDARTTARARGRGQASRRSRRRGARTRRRVRIRTDLLGWTAERRVGGLSATTIASCIATWRFRSSSSSKGSWSASRSASSKAANVVRISAKRRS